MEPIYESHRRRGRFARVATAVRVATAARARRAAARALLPVGSEGEQARVALKVDERHRRPPHRRARCRLARRGLLVAQRRGVVRRRQRRRGERARGAAEDAELVALGSKRTLFFNKGIKKKEIKPQRGARCNAHLHVDLKHRERDAAAAIGRVATASATREQKRRAELHTE